MNKTGKTGTHLTALLQLIVSAVFLIGMLTFLAPCGPKDDGSFMSCHYAGLALTILAVCMTVLSLIALFLKQRAGRMILSVINIVPAVAALIIPGTVIGLCMMPEMRCRAVMRPGSIVFSVLIILISIVGIIADRKTETR